MKSRLTPAVLWTAGKLAKRREKQPVKGANLNEVSDSLMLCEGTRLAGALEAFFNTHLNFCDL